MDIANRYCIYIGTTRGALALTHCKPDEPVHFDLESVGKNSEVTALKWGRTEDEIIIGNRDGEIKLYDAVQNKYKKNIVTDNGKGAVIGLGTFDKSVIFGKQSGDIFIWRKKLRDNFSLNLNDESTLDCMTQSLNRTNIIGTGGETNDLKLWDVKTKECIFKAKSLGHDQLNLRIPTSVRDICFFPDEERLTCCATKEGHILLYDERAQRRPVVKYVEPKASYTAITSTFNGRQCMVGTTRGYMSLIDLRTAPQCLKTFKSFTGSVTSIVCDPALSTVISTSLDRYLRVHDLNSKTLLHKAYMKQNLTKLLMKPIVKAEEKIEAEEDVDEEYEQLFNNMEVIEGDCDTLKPHKRKSLDHAEKVKKKKQ